MVSEKLNIAGNTIVNNQREIIAIDDEIKVSNNEDEIIDTTTTTVPTLQDSYEEEMQTSLNFKLPDSDGVDIYSSKISIYSTEEQTVLSKLIPGVSLEGGCLVEEIQELENKWINIIEANTYSEEKINFSISLESNLPIDINCLSNFITSILNDQRGWKTVVEKEFQVVNYYDADFHIFLGNPATVDEMCFPLQTNGIYSCRNGNQIIYNYFRWLSGAKDFGLDIATYRLYLINHEVGHMLGWGHTNCPSQNALAPLMMQQSKSTDGCIPNGWPIYERISYLYESVENFK
tara:strand:+ start:619 stop:1488 length:870 start_codon:yes stop_codon:yes gene_type:complete